MKPEGDGEFRIRPATPADAPRMWEIDQLCFEPGIAYPVDFIYYHLLVLRDPAFCAFDGKKLIGFVLTAHEKKNVGTIVTIDVLPEYRRKGLGSRLMALAEEALSARGARTITLQTAVENAGAIAFYGRHGYQQGRMLKNYYGKKRDAWQFEKKPV